MSKKKSFIKKEHFIKVCNGEHEIHAVEFLPATSSETQQQEENTFFCVHGLTRTWLDFETFCEEAAGNRGARAISVDIIGRGLSSWSKAEKFEKEYTVAFYCSYMPEVMEKLNAVPNQKKNNTTNVTFIGQSLGAIIGWNLASLFPETKKNLFSKVVLIDVGPEFDPAGIARIMKAAASQKHEFDTFAELTESYKARFSTMGQVPAEEKQNAFFVEHARRLPGGNWTFHFDPRAPANTRNSQVCIMTPLEEHLTKGAWKSYEAIPENLPILIVRGKESDLLSLETTQKMVDKKKEGQVQVVTVPASGHAPLLQTEFEIEAVLKFSFSSSSSSS